MSPQEHSEKKKRMSMDRGSKVLQDVANAGAEPVFYDDISEVFQISPDKVNFRTVSWPRACIIFLKIIFATGVLGIPTAMYSLGAVGGALSIIGWSMLNTYAAMIQGDFRNSHPKCHSIVDMANLVGGAVTREVTGVLFIIAYLLCGGSGILGVSIGLNALSNHSECTVWFTFIATIIVALAASVRKFEKIGWLTWVGFVSVFIAVFIIVIGVTTRSRPAAAPQTGDFDLGYYVIAHPSFVAGMTASATIYVSSAATSAFLPVISEMRNPKDYRKALFVCMAFVTAAYLSFSLVVYRWCGQWVANPSLGSAGTILKKTAYGIGLPGLIVSACLYLHIGAKYVFVRVLRNTKHLQANTVVHWGVWLGIVITMCALSFVLAEGIPIFSYLLALTGSICFAPIGIALPGWLWFYDHWHYRKGSAGQQALWWAHWFLPMLGGLFLVGGTYGTIQQIIEAYADGTVGTAFTCADNSGSTG